MYIPLAIGAFLLKPPNALIVGIFTPLISGLLTGMPPFYPPIAFTMAAGLGIFCLWISLLTHRFQVPVLVPLVSGLLIERTVMAVLYLLILPQFGVHGGVYTAYDLLKGMPGIILILVITPVAAPRCAKLLKKKSLRLYEHKEDSK
jgi:hypothetical protein